MTELFTFESLSVLAEPSPEALKESDPRWMLEASRREAALLATQDETDLNWLLKAAQFAQETAQYERSQGYLRRVLEVTFQVGGGLLCNGDGGQQDQGRGGSETSHSVQGRPIYESTYHGAGYLFTREVLFRRGGRASWDYTTITLFCRL